MGIIAWIVFGLIAGWLAKFIMPGKAPGGILMTMGLGIAGAFVGGFVGSLLGIGSTQGFSLVSMGLAVGGAVLLLFLYGVYQKQKSGG